MTWLHIESTTKLSWTIKPCSDVTNSDTMINGA